MRWWRRSTRFSQSGEARRLSDAAVISPSHEQTFIVRCAFGRCGKKPPACRPRTRNGVSLQPFRIDRPNLPAPAELLRIRRRGARPIRTLGRRVDDARAGLPLPSVGNVRIGLRGGATPAALALVPAMALWPMAGSRRTRRRREAGPPARPGTLAVLTRQQLEPLRRFPGSVLFRFLVPIARERDVGR